MKRPVLYLFGGSNGAGKTTFAKSYLPMKGVLRFMNADEIARGLSPLQPETSALKAGRLLLTEVRSLIERGLAFGLESTLSGSTYIKVIEDAKAAGYDIELHYVGFLTCSRRSGVFASAFAWAGTTSPPRM